MGGRGGGSSIASKAAAPSAAPAAPAAALPLDDRIVDAFPSAPKHWRDPTWATLEGLRDMLSDVGRDDLDTALKRLDRARIIELERDPDQKNITDSENAASIMFGGKRVMMYRVLR